MDNTQGIVIGVGIAVGIALLFGIYKLATSHLNASSTLRPGTRGSNGQQTAKAIFTVIISILVFVALFIAWQYFV